ncbi:hypothetical protein Droror1_Dr00016486 [Drosera rotundifolia]
MAISSCLSSTTFLPTSDSGLGSQFRLRPISIPSNLCLPISSIRASAAAGSDNSSAPLVAEKLPVIPVQAAVASRTPFIKWELDSWKKRNALQLPEYPDQEELEAVLKMVESFPPIVFAGEARHLEERLAEAAMGNAFMLQGGDCAESFKEFSANNIRDTSRVLLQMGVVLMFGGQLPVIKKQKQLKQNSGPLLQKQLACASGTTEKTKIFT